MNKLGYLILIFAVVATGAWLFKLNKKETPAKIILEAPRAIKQGEIFEVPLKLATSQSMNAAEFYFSFPQDLVEVEEIDQAGSIFQLWIKDQPKFDNALGELSLAGGLPKPGFVGRDGLVATVRFRAKKPGSVTINLDQAKSRVLANDGLGTKIEASFKPVSLTIK